MTEPEDGATPRGNEPSSAYANYVLGILFLVYVFNFVDRQILSILLEDIKRDLGVSDTAMGFLSGIAFALFYTVAGLPIARWADVGVRRSIIALGLVVWSGMTAMSGLVRSFGELVAARIGVGVGVWWIAITTLPVLIVIHFTAVLPEEAYLERKFGDAYRRYKSMVRRWI